MTIKRYVATKDAVTIDVKKGVSGVYQIKNVNNDKVYIGSSKDIRRRMLRHVSRLKRGVHKSPHLQNSWNTYGAEFFEFSVVEEVDLDDDINILLECEQRWMDATKCYEPECGYNIRRYACDSGWLGRTHSDATKEILSKINTGRFDGESNPFYGKTHTEETRKLLSDKAKERLSVPENNGMYGKRHTYESRRKISETRMKNKCCQKEQNVNSKLTMDDAAQIRQLYATGQYSQSDLGEKFGVVQSTIGVIVRNVAWVDPSYSYVPSVRRNGGKKNAAKLNMEIAREIRRLYSRQERTMSSLASEFNVCVQTIGLIIHNKTWIENGD
jgi:group I intron endonuclease